jgi:hypothetical protein
LKFAANEHEEEKRRGTSSAIKAESALSVLGAIACERCVEGGWKSSEQESVFVAAEAGGSCFSKHPYN